MQDAGHKRHAGSIPVLGRSLEEQMAAHSSTLAGEFHGRGRPQATVSAVAQSWTRLKRLSTHGRIRYRAWQSLAESKEPEEDTKLPFSRTPENWEELPTNVFSLLTYFPIRDKTQMSPTVWKQCVAMTTKDGYVLTESHDTEHSHCEVLHVSVAPLYLWMAHVIL